MRTLFGVGDGRGLGDRRVAGAGDHSAAEPRRRLWHLEQEQGHPLGHFLAALAFLASPWLGWRGMLALGIAPALLILYVRGRVEEFGWQASRAELASAPKIGLFQAMKGYWPRFVYAVVLMTFFNFFSHGS